MKLNIYILIFILLISGSTALTQVYVDIDNSSGVENGNSWSTAFTNIQSGINAASIAGGEVWVAEGVYYIYTNSTSNTISMKEGVFLYGGFAGSESQLGERDWQNNHTIIDGHQYSGSANRVQHVVSAKMVSSFWTDGLIDGFTITGGYIELGGLKGITATSPDAIISSDGAGAGAGLLIFQAAPNVSNCIISDNTAGKAGGVYVMVTTEWPIQTNHPAPTFTNVTIQNNNATKRGGGMQCDLNSHPVLINCKFLNNSCDAKGGGLYNDFFCSPTLTNCLFAGNTAIRAGAMGNDGSSSPTLTNCTITDNFTTDVGAGLYTGSYNPDNADSNMPELINCIVWGNSTGWGGPADLRVWAMNYYYIDYSCIGTGFTSFGVGNMQVDPLFVDPSNGDYRLQQGSPCVDAGTVNGAPSNDLNGNARDNYVDIGAYEYVNPMAISDITLERGNLNIYPNPAVDILNVVPETMVDNIEIYNMLGERVSLSNVFAVPATINITDLSPGIYIVKSGTQSSKLVISE